MNRTLRRVGVGLTVVTVGYTSIALIGLTARDVSTRSVSQRGVKAIVVDSDAGKLTFTGTTSNGVVSGTRREVRGLRSPKIHERVDAEGTLRISVDCSAFFNANCSADYTLTVPEGISIRAKSDGGSIRMADLSGPLDLESSAGSVNVDNVSGSLVLKSSAGRVEVARSTSEKITADSSAGSVKIELLAEPSAVQASSSAGGVTVIVPRTDVAYRVEAETSAGSANIKVKTDPESTRTITAESSAGDVNVIYPQTDTN